MKRPGAITTPGMGAEGLLPNRIKLPTQRTVSYSGSLAETGKRSSLTTPSPSSQDSQYSTSSGSLFPEMSKGHRRQRSSDLPVGEPSHSALFGYYSGTPLIGHP